MIWLVRPMNRDFNGLNKLGKICPIHPRNVSPLNIEKQKKIIREDVIPASSRNDGVLLAGPTIMLITLASVWREYHPYMNVVIWHHRTQKYISKRLSL